jgi:single-stranded-DNA-specific exonuclease
VRRDALEAFRAAFAAHAEAVLRPEDLVPVERVDAVVAGDELGAALAEELGRLAPFGIGNPAVSLLVPAARLVGAAPVGEGKHTRFTVEAGGVRARAIAFGTPSLPDGAADGRLHATFTLELDEYRGAVEPKLVLRRLLPADAEAPTLVGEPEPGGEDWRAAVLATARTAPALARDAVLVGAGVADGAPSAVIPVRPAPPSLAAIGVRARQPAPQRRTVRDRRDGGIAGTIAALVHTGEPVLVVCADAVARRRQLTGRLGGYAICSYDALERAPELADAFMHVVALDPPLLPGHEALLRRGGADRMAHLAWGHPELRCAREILDRDYALRPSLTGAYRALRDGAGLGAALGALPADAAGRLLRVLVELGLVSVDDDGAIEVPAAERTDLERSATFRAAADRHAEGLAWLTSVNETARAA